MTTLPGETADTLSETVGGMTVTATNHGIAGGAMTMTEIIQVGETGKGETEKGTETETEIGKTEI